MSQNILFLAAHPDDEVLGCGGTIARLSKENDIYIAILGEGHTSRDYKGHAKSNPKKISTLKESSERAADLLGAKKLIMYNLPDNRFDAVPLLDIVKIIEELVITIKPTCIYTHHGGDLNIDHSLTFRATITAARPVENATVKTIYSYEVPSATEWSFGHINKRFNPTVFENIEETIDKKIAAMQLYETETRSFPHPRSEEALRALASWRGSMVGLPSAEAFELIRDIKT